MPLYKLGTLYIARSIKKYTKTTVSAVNVQSKKPVKEALLSIDTVHVQHP